MNKKFKAKWIEALRSGKYDQARSRLRTIESFCCLGVACDLYDSKQWVRNNSCYYSYGPQKEVGGLPTSIVKKLNVDGPLVVIFWASSNTSDFRYDNIKTRPFPRSTPINLSSLNDMGFTFNQIADLIEYFL